MMPTDDKYELNNQLGNQIQIFQTHGGGWGWRVGGWEVGEVEGMWGWEREERKEARLAGM